MRLRIIALWLTLMASICSPASALADTREPAQHFSRTLYLIRHGAYAQDSSVDPARGGDLTPLGIAEARLVAARLRGLPVHFESLTSSTMARARETAAVIRESLPDVRVSETVELSECTPPYARTFGGDSMGEEAECPRRLDRVFAERFKPASATDTNELIVAHGNVIRYFVMKALGADTRAWSGIAIAHASLTVIQVTSAGRFRVLSVGDVGHLAPNMQSWGTEGDPELSLPR